MVPGRGPMPAFGMVVGEAPGEQETLALAPFVGPSGALLDQAFQLLDISRDELYITNVCKSWPQDEEGKTRRPNDEELAAWRPILDLELEQCSPAAILLLGKTAAEAWGWAPSDADTHNIWACWHPAFVLRQPSRMEEWIVSLKPFVWCVKRAQERA